MPRLHSGSVTDRLDTTKAIPTPIPKVVWQQPPETFVKTFKKCNDKNDPTIETLHTNHTPEQKHGNDVKSHRAPLKRTSLPNFGSNTELFPENQNQQSASTVPQQLLEQRKRIPKN